MHIFCSLHPFYSDFSMILNCNDSCINLSVLTTLPHHVGEYGLEIYANEPEEGDTYTHMCQYLIHYETPSGWRLPPRLTASGSDAGPSPDSVNQSWRQGDTGHAVRGADRSVKTMHNGGGVNPAYHDEPHGSLREMYNYEQHAPPMGILPKPYAQYMSSNEVRLPFDALFPFKCWRLLGRKFIWLNLRKVM